MDFHASHAPIECLFTVCTETMPNGELQQSYGCRWRDRICLFPVLRAPERTGVTPKRLKWKFVQMRISRRRDAEMGVSRQKFPPVCSYGGNEVLDQYPHSLRASVSRLTDFRTEVCQHL
jgi:hypothetical protein